MKIESGFIQGSQEWLNARLGSVGGSQDGISNIISSKGDRTTDKRRNDYVNRIAQERITGKPTKNNFSTFETKWGHEHEPEARKLFSFVKGFSVEECAMIWADDKKQNHISPDGIIIEIEKGLEIKCPQLKAFRKYIKAWKLPTDHILQVQTSLAVTGWVSWYYMVYFPGLKPMILEIQRDEPLIKIIKAEITIFNREVNTLIAELKS